MNLAKALRTDRQTNKAPIISFVGAGGKTTALFQLARDLLRNPEASVLVTATSHLGVWQTKFSDHHIIATESSDLKELPAKGIILLTGEIQNDRTNPVNKTALDWLRENSQTYNIPLLIEADGARQKSLKAPASHEPPIPEFSNTVIVLAGLQSLGKALTDDHVHRADIFSQLSGLQINQPITSDAILHVLNHSQGGLKNILSIARRVAFLNQADTAELQSIGGNMAHELLAQYDSVIVGALKDKKFQTFEHCAGIVLAAGESTRFGSPKQLLDWKGKPFVRQVAETALQAGLWPVVVVTGFHAADVDSALIGLPVNIIHNAEYKQGQSSSIRAGLQALPQNIGACVFLLADQPQIPVEVIRALIDSHTENLQPVLAPLVLEERRANPVLFDRVTFPDLLQLTGDVGGRAIFDKHHVEYLPWHDDILLFDVDKPEDYKRLKEME
jgi:molybdenum cofactor cytidylyltransferase